jgi:translation initiation factor 2A
VRCIEQPVTRVNIRDATVKQFKYSPLGNLIALVLPNSLKITTATGELVLELKIEAVLECEFSPKEKYISTWIRWVKPADGEAPKNNLVIYDISTGESVLAFAQKSQNDWYY